MRIGMILDSTFPPDPRVENEAISLINAGHEVYLFCLDYKGNAQKSEVINGINVRRQYVSNLLYKFSALAYTLPYYHQQMKKYIKTFVEVNNIEAIHIHDIQIARSIFNIGSSLPIVLDLHENRPEIMKYYTHVNTWKGRLLINTDKWKKFEYKYIQKADRVITVTEEAKDYYCKEIPSLDSNKFCIVPNTIRKAFYEESKIETSIIERYKNKFVLLYVGETGQRRGIELLIKAAQVLKDQIPNFKLVIVGSSIDDDKWRNLVNETGTEEVVDLEGWQSFELFPSYIQSSMIGVCPFHKNVHHDTTFANKLFQYMAFSKPIVASNCDAQQQVLETHNCGIIFEDQDLEAFVNAVMNLFQDREKYEKLALNASKAVKNELNWETTSQQLLEMYSDLAYKEKD